MLEASLWAGRRPVTNGFWCHVDLNFGLLLSSEQNKNDSHKSWRGPNSLGPRLSKVGGGDHGSHTMVAPMIMMQYGQPELGLMLLVI